MVILLLSWLSTIPEVFPIGTEAPLGSRSDEPLSSSPAGHPHPQGLLLHSKHPFPCHTEKEAT